MFRGKAWCNLTSFLLVAGIAGFSLYGRQVFMNLYLIALFLGILNSYKEGSLIYKMRDLFFLIIGLVAIGLYQTHFGHMSFGSFLNTIVVLGSPLLLYLFGFWLFKIKVLKSNQKYIFPAVFLLFGSLNLGLLNPMGSWPVMGFVFVAFFLNLALFTNKYLVKEALVINSPYFLIAGSVFIFGSGLNMIMVSVQLMGTLIAMVIAKLISSRFNRRLQFYLVVFSTSFILMLAVHLIYINSDYIYEYTEKSEDLELNVPLLYQGDTVTLDHFKGKVLVLDFWHTRCRYCFEKFPEFDKLTNKYRDRDDIQFFSVNVPLRIDKEGEAEEKIESFGYSFEHLFLLGNADHDMFGVQAFPTLVYIDPEQKRLITGSLETSSLVINNSISIIEGLLHPQVD